MLRIFLIALAGILLFAGGILFVEFSGLFEVSQISGFGWFAFTAAGVLTILMSAGLFGLMYYSSQSGHDDEIAEDDH